MNCSEIFSLTVLNFSIECLPRRKTGAIFAFFGVVFSLGVLFLQVPSSCEGCSEAVLQIGLVMVARFCLSFEFGLFSVAQTEYYPASVKGVGVATSALLGGFAIVVCQILMAYVRQMGVNPFSVITFLFAMMMVSYGWMVETHLMKPRDQVEEMRGVDEHHD